MQLRWSRKTSLRKCCRSRDREEITERAGRILGERTPGRRNSKCRGFEEGGQIVAGVWVVSGLLGTAVSGMESHWRVLSRGLTWSEILTRSLWLLWGRMEAERPLRKCGKQNNALCPPPQRGGHFLIPEPYECYLTWQRGLCRGKLRPCSWLDYPKLSRWDPALIISLLREAGLSESRVRVRDEIMETGVWVMWPQAKECAQLLEVVKGKDWILP